MYFRMRSCYYPLKVICIIFILKLCILFDTIFLLCVSCNFIYSIVIPFDVITKLYIQIVLFSCTDNINEEI